MRPSSVSSSAARLATMIPPVGLLVLLDVVVGVVPPPPDVAEVLERRVAVVGRVAEVVGGVVVPLLW